MQTCRSFAFVSRTWLNASPASTVPYFRFRTHSAGTPAPVCDVYFSVLLCSPLRCRTCQIYIDYKHAGPSLKSRFRPVQLNCVILLLHCISFAVSNLSRRYLSGCIKQPDKTNGKFVFWYLVHPLSKAPYVLRVTLKSCNKALI